MRPIFRSRRTAVAAALLAVATLAGTAPVVGAQSLAFEDLCYHNVPACAFVAPTVLFDGGPVLDTYAGFSWTNFRALDLINYPLHRPDPDPAATGTSGYPGAGGIYGDVVGLAFGTVTVRRPVSSGFGLFQLSDMAIGSGWTQGMTLGVVGSLNGQTVFTLPTQTLLATATSQLVLPATWIDEITLVPTFTPPGYGDPYHSAEAQSGRSIADGGTPYMSFWFDNVGYVLAPSAVVPEPGTLALFGGGLALLATLGSRRRRRD